MDLRFAFGIWAGVSLMAAAQPSRVSPDLQEQRLIRRVDPVYPPQAQRLRITGIVRFEARISRAGRVSGLRLISGHPLLIGAARNAIRQWRYRPADAEVITEIAVWVGPARARPPWARRALL